MEREAIAKNIQAFIEETFMVEFKGEVDPSTDLFESDFIDSFGFIELVAHMEQAFSVSLTDDDLASPEIGMLNGMVDTVIRCRQASE